MMSQICTALRRSDRAGIGVLELRLFGAQDISLQVCTHNHINVNSSNDFVISY